MNKVILVCIWVRKTGGRIFSTLPAHIWFELICVVTRKTISTLANGFPVQRSFLPSARLSAEMEYFKPLSIYLLTFSLTLGNTGRKSFHKASNALKNKVEWIQRTTTTTSNSVILISYSHIRLSFHTRNWHHSTSSATASHIKIFFFFKYPHSSLLCTSMEYSSFISFVIIFLVVHNNKNS